MRYDRYEYFRPKPRLPTDSIAIISDTLTTQKRALPRIPPLPENYYSFSEDWIEYVHGFVFLTSEADSTILKKHGFKIKDVQKRGSGKVIVSRARWPISFDLNSLPEQILKIRYFSLPEKYRPKRRVPRGPQDIIYKKYSDGITYVYGTVSLEDKGDAILLNEFGFKELRNFRYFWRDTTKVFTDARWPKDTPWDSLPPQIIGFGYSEGIRCAPLYSPLVPLIRVLSDSSKSEPPEKKPRRKRR